jgi:tetratricopeptide (TPR) repeat protein
MDISAEQYERIILFLDASMTLEEMEAFDKELAINQAMRQQLDFEQSIRDSFALKKSIVIPARENSIDGHTNRAPVKSINRKQWITIAVAASVLVAVITITLIKPEKKRGPVIVKNGDSADTNKKDTQELTVTKPDNNLNTLDYAGLYRQYFVKDDLPESYPTFLAEALISYNDGDYSSIQKLNLAAIPEMRGAGEKQTILDLGHYYKGIAFLKTGNTQQAIQNLQWIEKNSTDADLKIKAQWYLALAYLKSDNASEAISLLKKLAVNGAYSMYNAKAKSLLKEIE